jgi:hypothetical protein
MASAAQVDACRVLTFSVPSNSSRRYTTFEFAVGPPQRLPEGWLTPGMGCGFPPAPVVDRAIMATENH